MKITLVPAVFGLSGDVEKSAPRSFIRFVEEIEFFQYHGGSPVISGNVRSLRGKG